MGAAFICATIEVRGKNEVNADKAVRQRLNEMIDESLYEDGHSYSGCIGMAGGVHRRREHFETVDLAYEWLERMAEKWGPAVVVTAGNAPEADSRARRLYVYGAWCSE